MAPLELEFKSGGQRVLMLVYDDSAVQARDVSHAPREWALEDTKIVEEFKLENSLV